MLVDYLLMMTTSLNILYLPTHPRTPYPLHPKLKLLVAHISGKIDNNSQLDLLVLSRKVTSVLVLFYGLRISTFTTFDVNLITMSKDTCIFYPSELLKKDRQGRPRDKIIYQKFGNSKLCPMAVTKEYLKCRAEYNVVYTKCLFTTLSPSGQLHKDRIDESKIHSQ